LKFWNFIYYTWYVKIGVTFVISELGFTILKFFGFQNFVGVLGSELNVLLLCDFLAYDVLMSLL